MSPLVLLACLAVAPEAAADTVVLQSDVMVAMRDGTQLATDLYLPAQAGKVRAGRFPTLLMRTPYGQELRAGAFSGAKSPARYFASRGYVVVMQDVRGRYRSQGRWRPWYDDGRDGYDTAVWIARQPWSDGGIGTIGTSYEGGTQQALALANAPHLQAMVPLFSVSNIARYGACSGSSSAPGSTAVPTSIMRARRSSHPMRPSTSMRWSCAGSIAGSRAWPMASIASLRCAST